MSKAYKGISAKIADFGINEFFTGRQSFLAMKSLSQPAVLVSPFTALDESPSAPSFDIAVDSSDELLSLDFDGKLVPFGLPCISDEKMLRLMALDSVNGAGFHSETDSSVIDDEAIVSIAVGGSVSGVIDFTGDTDDITVSLVAGQKYLFSERGTGPNALNDTFLQLRNPSNTLVASDDDGGNGLNSIFSFTATVTGVYTIRAGSFDNGPSDPGTGGWTVDVRVQGADAVGATNGTSVPLGLGTTFGFRETGSGGTVVVDPNADISGDLDRYSVNLVAGHFYTWKVAGGIDSDGFGGATEIDTYVRLVDASGNLLAKNDDNGSTDFSSSLGFFAETTGTYYFDVTGWTGTSGGYVIDFQEVPIGTLDPLDSIDWRSAGNMPTVNVGGVPTAYVYFAVAGQNFGENARAGDPTQPAGGGNGTLVSFGWTQYEKDQFLAAMQEYTKILGITYVETSDANLAAASGLRVITNSSLAYGAYAYPQDPAYGTQKGIAVFNVDNRGWNLDDPNPAVTTDGLGRGGYAWSTILHEMGHAHGLAHPHDTGGGSDVMVGVTAAQGSLGVFNLNQGVYTQMSYNGGWWTNPDGSVTGTDPTGFRSDAGWEATLGAFDIALLQEKYGVHPAYATGDTVYTLNDVNAEGTFFECIYDTGGTDTIAYTGIRAAQIDLNTATLDYTVTGGGIVSFVHNLAGETAAMAIKGGFTIANGVVIENATGGSGDDVLIGNAVANVLTGNQGNDSFMGGGGNDNIVGGAGADTAYYDGNRANYTVTVNYDVNGNVTGYTVTDNFPANAAPINDEGTDTLTGVEALHFADVTLSLAGSVALYDASDVLVGTFATIQAAINAAGTDYRVEVGAGTYAEHLTVGVQGLTIEGMPGAVLMGTFLTDNGVTGDLNLWLKTAAAYSQAAGVGITVNADGVTISGLTVSAFNQAILLANGSDGTTLAGVTLSHNFTGIHKPGSAAVTGFTMAGGSISDGHIGMDIVRDPASGGIFDMVLINGTSFADLNRKGIYAEALSNAQLLNLVMSNVGDFGGITATGALGAGGNGINLNLKYGTYANILIQGFTLTNVGSSDRDGAAASHQNGGAIVIEARDQGSYSGDPATLSNVTVQNGTINGTSTGIQVGEPGQSNATPNVTVDNVAITNAVHNALHGDVGNQSAATLTFTGTAGADTLVASGNSDGAIVVNGGAGNDTITTGSANDTINGGADNDNLNGMGGIDTAVVGTSATFAANGSSWTVTSSAGTDTLTNIEIVDSGPGANTLLVGSGGFATIQAAINAASDGDTILVASGTYVEQVVVNGRSNLTIQAAPGATVTIQAPADVIQTATSSSGRAVNAVVTVTNGTNIVFDNINVDGAGHGNTVDGSSANFIGVYYRNASGSLLGVDIGAIRDPYDSGTTLSGIQRGVGLQVDNDSLRAFTMTGGSIFDFQKNATVFNYAILTVTGVTVTGGGAQTINAQNGFQISNSTGTISGNTITGIGYAGPADAYSAGVLAFGNTNLDILNNIITGTNGTTLGAQVVGIYILDFGTPNSGGTISGNTISHVDTGIGVYGDIQPNGITIGANDITNIDTTDPYAAGVDFEPNPGLAVAFDVTGTAADDILYGAAGNDNLKGLGGNDDLMGNGGDDILAGGAGTGDTAIYAGARSGYTYSYTTDGSGRATGFTGVDDTNPVGGDEGTDTLSGVEALQFLGQTLNVNDPVQLFDASNVLVGTFTTIQAAVNASSAGYTLRIAAGIFTENVNFHTAVTVLGAHAGDDGASRTGSNAAGETTLIGRHDITAATGAVTINGLRFVNNATTTGGGAGDPILQIVTGGGHLVTNSVFYSEVQGGNVDDRAISMPVIGSGQITISNNYFTGAHPNLFGTASWQRAVWFDGGGVDLDVTGNTFQYVRSGLNLDMSGDSEVEVSGNLFTSTGSGVVVGVDAVGLTVLDNDFTNVGDDFSFRNLAGPVVFDAETAVDALSPVGNPNDYVVILGGSGGDTLSGSSNADYIDANNRPGNLTVADADILDGRAGNDILFGRFGDDTLTGGANDDSIDGGDGYDSAIYGGNRSDYIVTLVSAGVIQIQDTRPGTPDGTDQLTGVERIVFADDDYSVNPDGTLTLINFPPVAVDDVNSATEDGAVVVGSVATNDSDPDPGETATLAYSLNAPVAGLTLNLNGGYSFDPSNAAYQHLAVGATVNVVATYTVTDDNLATDTGTLTITVTGTNDAPVVTSGPATGSVVEAISLDGIRGADQTADHRLEPVVNYDSAIVSLLAAHPTDMHAVLLGLQAQLPSGSGIAEAIAIVWDYVDDNFSYYNTVINEVSARLSVEYALYLLPPTNGGPLTGTAAKYTPDGVDVGSAPDRYQSLHDNILGNVNGAGLIDKFLGAGQGSNPNPDQAAYDRIIALLNANGLSDLVNRPVYSGTEGAPNLSLAYDQTHGLLAPATGGQLTATDVDDGAVLTWSGSATGIYGAFSIAANGAWTYALDQFDPDTQALGAGESAVDTFTATVSDGLGGTATQLVTITVFGTNDAPVGVATALLPDGSEDVVYHVTSAQLLAGFSDLDGDTLSVLGLSASHGTVVAEPGGFAITLDPDYYGPVVLSYQVDDGNGGRTSAVQTFDVNGAPDVTGPVLASATEGGGVIMINPLANSSDPDGDSLVVIPVGPLPAGVSFVGGSAATINFSDYALGTVVGQHGWTDGSPGSPADAIVDVSGNRMLRLANDPTSGDFGGPFSPAFAIAAGEAAAAADTLSFSFVIKAVNGAADGSRLEIDLGSSDRDDRYNFMAIEYTAGGLRLVQNTPTTAVDVWQSDNFDWGGNVQLGALLNASVSHTIQVIFRAVDGSNNDIVEYYVDGMLVGTGSTFENFAEFHAGQPHSSAINSVNNVLFRAGDPVGNPFPADGPGGNRQGFYIDDLNMSAYDSHRLQFNASDPAYDHLAAGATQLVTVNYNVADGHGGVTPTSTVITVTGTNDGATITGVATGAVVESGVGPGNTPFPGTPSASGMLTVTDVDDGEAELAPVNAAGANGYGTFAVAADGSWTYTLNNADADTNALYVGQVVTDTIIVHSEDNTASQTITVTITGTNDLPVITGGPVLASATEGGGVIMINPLAHASDPDAGDGLVVIPVGPLPAGVSFVGGSAATINFSDYALGTVVGQHGWTDGSPGSPADAIVDVSGNRMLRLANDPTSGDFGGPFSPAFAIAAGEAAAAADTLSFSFVIRAVNGAADGSRLEIDLGSSDRDDRYNFMAIEYTAGGLRLVQNTPTTAVDVWQSDNFDWGGNVQLGALLNASVSHTIQVIFRAVDGSNNDIVEYYVDGMLVGTGSTFENFAEFHAGQPHASAINSVNNVLFRAGDPAGNPFPADGPGGNRQGFYIDDLNMSAYDSHRLQFNASDPAYDHLAAGATQLVTVNYNVADGHGGVTPTSTVITVTGTNDGATITGVATGAVVESGVGPGNTPFPGTPSASGTLTVTDVDDGEAELAPVNAAGANGYGTFAVAADGSWTYTLNNADADTNALYVGQVVTDTIIVHSEDNTASQTITVTITGTNDAPVITNGPGAASGSVSEGISPNNLTPAGTAGGLEPAINYDGQIVSLLAAHPDDMPAVLAGIQALLPAGSNGLVNAIAVMWDYVDDHFSYYDTVINEISGRLSAEYARHLALGGAPLTGTVAKYAVDGGDVGTDPDRLQSLHDNLLGNLSLAGLNDKLRGPPNGSNPNPDESAYNQIIALLASYGLSDVVNRPYFGGYEGETNLATAYDQAHNLLPPATGGQLTASDVDTDAVLTWSGSGTSVYGAFAITTGGAWTYNLNNLDPDTQALAAGTSAVETFTATVTDNHGATATEVVTVIVYGTNDAPVAVADTNAGTEDGALVTGSVATNDSDVDTGAVLSYALAAPVAGLTLGSNGSYSFDPGDAAYDHIAQGATQIVVANYIVSDGNGGSSTSTLTITVTGINDAPDAVNDIASAIEDGAVVLGSVAGNDTDIDDGATRTWALVAPVAGLTLDSAGNYVFNPLDPAYQHIAAGATQTVVASYRVTDQFGATDVATLTITVSGSNDAPDAANDVNGATEDGAIVSGNVGSNDTDVDDGATRTFALVAAAPAGLTFNPDGSYSFNPSNAAYQHLAVGATETLVIGYTISDGSATDTATLTITVNGTNDAPVAADDVNTAFEDGAVVTGTVATGDTDVDDGATRTYALSGSVAGLTINPDGSYSFDPASYDSVAAGDTQIVTATYIVTDDKGATDTGTLAITVSGVNDDPDAVNDTNSAIEDGAVVSGTVATNDTDVDIGDTRTYTLNAAVAGLSLASDGSYTFNPTNAAYQHIALGATQTVVATYTFADNHGGSDTATLTFTVTGTNDAPVAGNDVIVATEDGPIVTGNLGVNDTDVDDGATRTFLLLAPVAGLSLSPSGNYIFDPSSYDTVPAGGTLILSASYRVVDNNGANDTATITITVNGINDAPDAVNDINTATEDGAIVNGNVSFNDVDPDSADTRTYALNGTVDGLTINSDGSYSFDPSHAAYQHIALGATQTVVATYTMTDGLGATDTATLTITVNGANDGPVAAIDTGSVAEDGGTITGNVGANDTDVDDGATRAFTAVGPVPAGLTFNGDGSYSFDPSDAAYQHLAAGVTQLVTLTYTIADQHGATDTSTLTITVTGVNDAPVAGDDVASAIEDGAVVTGNVGANDADVDTGAIRTYALSGTVPGLTIAANGDYSFDPSNAAYQHLAQGATDTIVATYTVTDQLGATDTATLTITVAGANDAPVALDDNRAVNEDGGTISGNVGANDTDVDDGATRTFTAAGPLPAGLSFGADGSYSFDPTNAAYQHLAQGVTELVTLTYTISDSLGGTDTATLTITVTGVNDAPVAGDDVASAIEDGAVVTGTVATNDSDVDTGATRTYALVGTAPAGLTFNPDGSYSFDPASYDSIAAGATQIVTVTYTATDQLGATDTATLTITVNGINDAPDAVNDVNGATEDGAVVTGNVATNDTDVDAGDTRTYALAAPVAGLTLAADGSYSFDPASYDSLAFGATQIVVATYRMTDGLGATDTATLTITVTGVNDAPDAVNDVASATEDGAVVTGSVATNDSDVDVGDTRAYTLDAPVAGLTFNADGSYSFDPASYDSLAFGATQIVVATYRMTDGQGVTDTATLTITVTGVNDAPDAVNEVNSATEDGAVVTGNVATNDSDVDVGDTRIYTLNAPVAGLILHANGSYSFDPASYDSLALGATQIVVATYTMTDGQGATDTATLTITVTGVNDAPDAVNDVASATEDGAIVTGSVATNDSNVDVGDTLAYTLNAPVAGLTFNADGSYSFDPVNSAYQSLAAGATQNVIASYTVTDSLGATDTATLTITVTGTDDAPVIHPDAFVTAETTTLTGNLFANNGSGPDSDVDGPLIVAAINGSGANVGTQITLASGARLTVNLNGSFIYDPNHAFDATPAAGSGASNMPASDSFTYTLAGGGTATVTLSITGVDSNDTLNGTAGNDVLIGGIGADTMTGGAGDDIYFVENGADLVIEAAGQGFDTVYSSVSYGLSGAASVEVLSTVNWAGTAPIALTGSSVANTIFGNAGDNVLDGGGGADSLYGFGGDDVYIVDNAGDAVAEADGGGYDTIYTSVTYTLGAGVYAEVLSTIDWTSTSAINLTGNALANRIYGNAGVNLLIGGEGDDVLAGFGGGDTLIGGVGDDTYWIYAAGDVITETGGGGFDTAFSYTSYTLAADSNVEVLSTFNWLGVEAINFTGNGISNIIYGNAGANTLNGGGGADLLFGLGGADTFAFTTALGGGNVDTLYDFVHGTDKIALDDAIFTAISGGTLSSDAFVIGTGAGDANDRIIYNSTTGQLFYDADGNGSGVAVQFAYLGGGLALSASDFQMI